MYSLLNVCVPTHISTWHAKVADRLANIAMDTNTSRSLTRPSDEQLDLRLPGIRTHIDADVEHWASGLPAEEGAADDGV